MSPEDIEMQLQLPLGAHVLVLSAPCLLIIAAAALLLIAFWE